ncbi:MAG TPA: sigma-54 dependent transcriptional regulator [Polyangia bacterium]|jgi:NtrC-family two-component system response regulator AlgB|nr:sigma-54 dependent transcriptional regulator [Polyangia bacterium]
MTGAKPLDETSAGLPPLAVLIVDDEKNIRATLRMCLEAIGAQVVEAASAEAAHSACQRQPFDLAFVDLRLGEANGLTLIPPLLAASPLLEIVVITAYGTVETAVEAIQLGARDVLQKPFSPAQIRAIAERVDRRRGLTLKLRDLRTQVESAAPDIAFESRSPRVRQLLAILAKAATHDVSVLLRGENGTGKSVLARQLHTLSGRSAKPFVVVNCPTLSPELLASELFGHARGAFTGAVKDQEGRVEAAEGGTLFLDEIGELPPSLQAKLLRFLQDRQFERLGENQTRTAHVRIVAATNRDIEAEVAAGRFRQDLLFRLNTFEITVPPLRERREDILPLAYRFLALFAESEQGAPPSTLSPEAEAALLAYDWPGNLRELRNAMERAAILAAGPRIDCESLPDRIGRSAGHKAPPHLGGDYTLEEIEREHIQRVLGRTATAEEAARILGIDTSTLWRRRKRYEGGG